MMQETAQKKNVPIEEVQRLQAELGRNKAFNGEWIELPQPDGTYVWKQKGN